MTIEITNDQVVKYAKALVATGKQETYEAAVNYLAERAVKDAVYRAQRNQQKWAEQKALNERRDQIIAKAKEMGLDVDGL